MSSLKQGESKRKEQVDTDRAKTKLSRKIEVKSREPKTTNAAKAQEFPRSADAPGAKALRYFYISLS